jgi:hypothetical protein
VAYAGGDRILERLARWASDATRPVVILAGGAGTGKTTLLGAFAARSGSAFRVVRLSDPRVDPDALSLRILDELGEVEDHRPRAALARVVQGLGDRPLLLLIDDADALSPRSEVWLFDLVRRNAAGLRVVLAVAEARMASELASAFGAGTEVISTGTPMSRAEVDACVRAELARSGGGCELDDATLAGIHARSGGVPGRVWLEAAALLARAAGEAAPPPRAASATPPRAIEPEAGDALVERVLPPPRRPAAQAPPAPAARPQGPPVNRPARRESLLRWLILPGALAASFVAGFVSSELLALLRPAASPERARAPIAEARPAAIAPGADQPLPAVASAPPPGPLARPAEAAPPAVEARPPAEPPAPSPPAIEAAPPAAAPEAPRQEATAVEPVKAPPAAESSEPAGESAAARASTEPPPDQTPSAAAAEPARERKPQAKPARPARTPPVSVQVSAEAGAEVSIDGQSIGAAPVDEVDLAPGPHHFLVRLPDGRVAERTVDVQGKEYDVRFR